MPLFALQFALQDNEDEHTLVRFIMEFKGVQFFTTGLVAAFMLSFHYFHCLTALDSMEFTREEARTHSRAVT